jgi:hypothetical protein
MIGEQWAKQESQEEEPTLPTQPPKVLPLAIEKNKRRQDVGHQEHNLPELRSKKGHTPPGLPNRKIHAHIVAVSSRVRSVVLVARGL